MGVGGTGVGTGVGGASTGADGALAAASVTTSSDGLSGAAAAITSDETIETGTDDGMIGATSFLGHDTRASASTPRCRAIDPMMAGLGRCTPYVPASGAVSVIRFSLVKPPADSRAITRATA